MGLFDFFKKKKPLVTTNINLPAGISLSKDLLPHWPKIESGKLEYVKIEVIPNDHLGILQSKFAGAMYLPRGSSYPVDYRGKYMFPLAQINFSEVPPLDGYPEKGILQFYISDDDVYGMDFDNQTNQKGFRVLYFENPDEENAEKDFSFLDNVEFESVPITKQTELRFSKAVDYAGIGDVRFEKHFGENVYDWTERFEDKEDAIFTEMDQLFSGFGHKIGGYAGFTQDDPRYNKHEDWILLLQINSEWEYIMWGDMGICNFFIHPEDLRKRDFSKVMYNWDCT